MQYFDSHKYCTKDILNSINEIKQFYPWINIIEDNYNSYLKSQETFDNLLKKLITVLFDNINPRQYGEYYTPLNIISLSFDQINLDVKDKVIDPSCGSGFFLSAYIEKIYELGLIKEISDIKKLQQNIYGYDIFPFAIITTKLLLGYKINNIFKTTDGIFEFDNIKVNNTLSTLDCNSSDNSAGKNTPDFDFIFGNPPFFRIDPKNKNGICNCISFGHNYAQSIFLHWSIQNLKIDGKLCLFLPQSMLSGYYYKKSRKELLTEMSLDLIITNKEHEKDFKVQQDIMILIAHKNNNKNNYYNIAKSNDEYTSIEKYKLPISIIENRLNVIPTIKDKKEYSALEDISKLKLIDKVNQLIMSTGNFVWNQNKELCFESKVDKSIPLINGPNVTLEGVTLEVNRSNNKPYCIPNNEKYIKNEYAILFRRMSPIGNEDRMIACIVDPNIIGNYVVENHVNIITFHDKNYLNEILQLITSRKFNILLDSFCQSNQISTNELKIIFEVLQKMRDN